MANSENTSHPLPTSESVPDNSPVHAYLVLRLDNSDYAIRVEHVREIITSVTPSPVPGAPDYLMGVINLRGKILPMVDLRRRFRLPIAADDERDCYIVLMVEIDDQLVELGVRVDAVCEVARISEQCVDNTNVLDEFSPDRLVFQGVAKTTSGVKLVLDTRQLISQLRRDVHLTLASNQSTNSQNGCLVTTG